MGFNFNGMMRGLGTGMVSTGALMEKYNERKFEEEQLQAKLDREEHMERLRQQAIKEENVLNRAHDLDLQDRRDVHDETMTSMQMEQQQKIADRDFQVNMQRLKGEQAERGAAAQYRSQQAARETEIYNMKMQEIKDKDTAIAETSKALYPDDPLKQKVWTSMQKGYISLEGKEKIGSEAVSKAIDTAAPLVEAIKDKDLPKEAALLGITTKGKSNIAIRSQMTAIVAGQIAETASGGSGGGMLKLPSDTTKAGATTAPSPYDDMKYTRKQALAGDSKAITIISSMAKSPEYKNNRSVQDLYKQLQDKNKQTSPDVDSPFLGFEPFNE